MEGLFQPLHLIIILVIVLIIFGPSKLPDLGAGLGKSITAFKKAMREQDESKEQHKAVPQDDEKDKTR